MEISKGGIRVGSPNRTEPNTSHVWVVFGLLNEPEMSVRFGSVQYKQGWIRFMFVLFGQFMARSSQMLGKLHIDYRPKNVLSSHSTTDRTTPNTNRTRTEHWERLFGSVCVRKNPNLISGRFAQCSVRFGSVRRGSVRRGSVRRATSGGNGMEGQGVVVWPCEFNRGWRGHPC